MSSPVFLAALVAAGLVSPCPAAVLNG